MRDAIDSSVCYPINGCITSLHNVSDEMFREEMLGKTICIQPLEMAVYAPFDGVVNVVYPTAHAVGIVREDGLEVLIHVGIDTVELNGVGFHAQVEQGTFVKRHTLLLKFDADILENNKYSTQTFIVFTNSKKYQLHNFSLEEDKKIKDVLCYAEKLHD